MSLTTKASVRLPLHATQLLQRKTTRRWHSPPAAAPVTNWLLLSSDSLGGACGYQRQLDATVESQRVQIFLVGDGMLLTEGINGDSSRRYAGAYQRSPNIRGSLCR